MIPYTNQVESLRTIITHVPEPNASEIHFPSLICVAVSFLVKLALFFLCLPLRKEYPQVNALWQDHRNDLVVNAFGPLLFWFLFASNVLSLGITTSVLGKIIYWWIDPVGAILISTMVLASWSITAYRKSRLLLLPSRLILAYRGTEFSGGQIGFSRIPTNDCL